MAEDLIGRAVAVCLMALALGMDAFSVCMGMGMSDVRLRRAGTIGFWIGLFHILMPLTGIVLGHLLSQRFGHIAVTAAGLLLVLIGAQMLFSIKKQERPPQNPRMVSGTGMILFAMSVSIDSFSVGLSMGLFGAGAVLSAFFFGLVSMIMAWSGFFIGKGSRRYVGRYGEALGGGIMLLFGLKLIFQFSL